ncbi:MAG: hypothetical protein CVU34_03625 [Betaproteobacteria bacterium HGW-Betaproteobacteria-7]|jgi:uncharacterized membrane protein YhaH (DUF805 family)/glutaredoxin/ribosomal protein L40E|nr:MAG: hypothetical protein CVU34_03625 [Betaproteobacteria bacterium HGW-Betaproteobacteria-7]
MEQQYRVVISGRTIGGRLLGELREDVSRAFKLQGEQLERMLSGRPLVVSRRSSRAAAEKLQARLQALSLEARIEAISDVVAIPTTAPAAAPLPAERASGEELFALNAPAAVVPPPVPPAPRTEVPAPMASVKLALSEADELVCPKCGEAQPKRTLCRKCGLDMPRFLAARAAAEDEAREEREASLAAQREAPRGGRTPADPGERQAGLFGISFSGRLGRLDYLVGSLLSTIVWLFFVLLAVKAGKPGIAGLGILISVIYGVRCIALRLHDSGRTGWLSLVILVPVLGAVMTLILLFIPGDDEANEHGPEPAAASGGRLFIAALAFVAIANVGYRTISQSPEKMALFLQAVSLGQATAEADENDASDESAMAEAPVEYADDNTIDIYVMAGCASCDQMRAWLHAKGLRHSVLAVDSDPQAAERLRMLIAGDGEGRIMLPVLVINGDVLPVNPDAEQVYRRLRRK